MNSCCPHMAKRALDIVVAITALMLLSPLLAIISVTVRVKLGGPVLFSQRRPGLHGTVFLMYKFRSMTDARDAHGELLKDELRLTPFGAFFRSSSLDELPALWNVLKGDMSLVGPRPLLVDYLPLYNAEQARRHEVRPGITGWAQVNGRNSLTWEERFKFDVWYVDNHTFWLDLSILVATVKRVIQRDGISDGESATMKPFKG